MDNIINEDVFTRVALELFIPPKYKAGMENIDYFGSSYVSLSDSRNFVVQGEFLLPLVILRYNFTYQVVLKRGVVEMFSHNESYRKHPNWSQRSSST